MARDPSFLDLVIGCHSSLPAAGQDSAFGKQPRSRFALVDLREHLASSAFRGKCKTEHKAKLEKKQHRDLFPTRNLPSAKEWDEFFSALLEALDAWIGLLASVAAASGGRARPDPLLGLSHLPPAGAQGKESSLPVPTSAFQHVRADPVLSQPVPLLLFADDCLSSVSGQGARDQRPLVCRAEGRRRTGEVCLSSGSGGKTVRGTKGVVTPLSLDSGLRSAQSKKSVAARERQEGPDEREDEAALGLAVLPLFLWSRSVLGYWISAPTQIPLHQVFCKPVLEEGFAREWLSGKFAQPRINEERLPLISAAPAFFRGGAARRVVASPSLHLSIKHDLALLFLSWNTNAPALWSRLAVRILSNATQAGSGQDCPAGLCQAPAFCFHQVHSEQGLTPERAVVESRNLRPWFDFLLVTLSAYAPLAEARVDSQGYRYLHLLQSSLWTVLWSEIAFLQDTTLRLLEQRRTASSRPGNAVRTCFGTAWKSHLRQKRYLYLKSMDPASPMQTSLFEAAERTLCALPTGLERDQKERAHAKEASRRLRREAETQGGSVFPKSLRVALQVLGRQQAKRRFKVINFLTKLEELKLLPGRTNKTRGRHGKGDSGLCSSFLQEAMVCCLEKVSVLGPLLAPIIYKDTMLIFQEAAGFFRTGSLLNQRVGSTRKHPPFSFLQDLKPWCPGLLKVLLVLDQANALGVRRCADGSDNPLSLTLNHRDGSAWETSLHWTLVAHFVAELAFLKALGMPVAIVAHPEQSAFHDLVEILDALMHVPAFAAQYCIQWCRGRDSVFVNSSAEMLTQKAVWEHHSLPVKSVPNRTSIFLVRDLEALETLHARLSKVRGQETLRWGKILHFDYLQNAYSQLPPCQTYVRVKNSLPPGTPRSEQQRQTHQQPEGKGPETKKKQQDEGGREGGDKGTALPALPARPADQDGRVTLWRQGSATTHTLSLESEAHLGGFVRACEVGETVPEPQLAQCLCALQDLYFSVTEQQAAFQPVAGSTATHKANLQNACQANAPGAAAAAGGREAVSSPEYSTPTLASFLLFIELQLTRTTVKTHLQLFRKHLWPRADRPRISTESLQRQFKLVRELACRHKVGSSFVEPLAPKQMIQRLVQYTFDLRQNPRETSSFHEGLAARALRFGVGLKARSLRVPKGLLILVVTQDAPEPAFRGKIRAALLRGDQGSGDRRHLPTWQVKKMSEFPPDAPDTKDGPLAEGLTEEETTAEKQNTDAQAPHVLVGSLEELKGRRAAWTRQLVHARVTHLFVEESLVSAIKSQVSWLFTMHDSNGMVSDLLNLWPVAMATRV